MFGKPPWKKYVVLAGLFAVALLLGMAGTAVRTDTAQAKPEDVITFSPNVCIALTTSVLEGDWDNDGNYDAADAAAGQAACAAGLSTGGSLNALARVLGADVIPVSGAVETTAQCGDGLDNDADTVIDDGCAKSINDPALFQDLDDLSGSQLGDTSTVAKLNGLWVLTFVTNDEAITFEADEGVWSPALTSNITCDGLPAPADEEDGDGDGVKGDKIVVERLIGNAVADLGESELVATQGGVDVIYDYVVVGDATGSISGTVADASGNPLVDCDMTAYSWNWSGGGSDGYGQTGEAGFYMMSGLAPGNYRVRAWCDGYVHEYYNDKLDQDSADPVSVVEAQNTQYINFNLNEQGTISGTVTDTGGSPLEGCDVYADPQDGTGTWFHDYTNENGFYTIAGLATDTYVVQVFCAGYVHEYFDDARNWQDATPVPVVEANDTPNIDFNLRPGGTISGRVTDSQSSTIEGCEVQAFSWDWDGSFAGYGWDLTDANGEYMLTDLATDSYSVQIDCPTYLKEYYDDAFDSEDATPVSVVEGQTTAGIDFALDLAASISGTVVDMENDPVEGAHVEACPISGGGWCESSDTDVGGLYVIGGLSPKVEYRVRATADGYVDEYYNGVRDYYEATAVGVTEGQDTPNIDFSLGLGGTVSGIVTDAQGNPIGDAWVSACPYTGYGYCKHAYTGPDGSYTITGLATGSYRVEADADDYIREYYDGVRDYNDATPVAVLEGQDTPNINFEMDLGGTISGVVRDDQGNPLAGASVSYESCGGMVLGWQNGGQSGADGTYVIRGLATGDYAFSASHDGYVTEYYDNTFREVDRTCVSLTEGQDTPNIDFSLELGGSISGDVTDGSGHPVSNVEVQAYAEDGNSGSVRTDSNGHYVIQGLVTSNYIVETAGGGYVTEYYDGVRDWEQATHVAVTQPQETPNINFVLDRGAIITGRATDASSGDPIPNVQVTASGQHMGMGGQTDTNGVYAIGADTDYYSSGLPTGCYVMDASGGGYVREYYDGVRDYEAATQVCVIEGETTANIDFALDLGGTISGTVTLPGGGPIPMWGAYVNAISADGTYYGGYVEANGTYAIDGLATGDYIVKAYGSGYASQYYNGARLSGDATVVHVVEGQETTSIDFDLQVEATVSGVVRDGQGNPLQYAYVRAEPWPGGAGTDVWFGSTGADGSYVIHGLSDGCYVVWALAQGHAPEYYGGVHWQEDGPTQVCVQQGSATSGIDFAMDDDGTISGKVTDADGHPVSGLVIGTLPVDHGEPSWWWPSEHKGWIWGWAITGYDGTYTVGGLASGLYKVWVQGPDYLTTYYDGVFASDAASPVAVSEGENTPDIDFGATERVFGDANRDGKLSMVDAMFVAQAVVGLRDQGDVNAEMADVNYCQAGGEGATMIDAMLIAQKVVGLIPQFPCAEPPPSPSPPLP